MTTEPDKTSTSTEDALAEDLPGKDTNHHDSGYKELFSYPELVQQLIEGFTPKELVKLMDFNTLKQHNGHYITPPGKYHECAVEHRI